MNYIQRSFLFYLLTFLSFNAFSQTWKWAKSAVGNEHDIAMDVASDSKGNVISVGYFTSDSLTIENYKLLNNSKAFSDIFIIKYDSIGKVIWAIKEGGRLNDRAYSVSTDRQDNIYVTGYFYSDTIQFGSFILISTDAVADMFIVKYDKNGKVVWAKKEGGNGLEIPYSIVIDNNNNPIIAGRFAALSIQFGTHILSQKGSYDVFLVKYDSSGNVQWAKGAGGGTNDEAFSVDVDMAGNIYVVGYFNQKTDFGKFNFTSVGQSDIFIAKYSADGDEIWVKTAGGKGVDEAKSISVDDFGNCYIAGNFKNDFLYFDSKQFIQPKNGNNSFIAKYDANGNFRWAKSIHGESKAEGIQFIKNTIYVCGNFSGDTLLYGNSQLLVLGQSDFYLLNCDTAGNPKWIIKQTAEGLGSELAYSLAADLQGNITLVGTFGSHDPIVFGGDQLNPTGNSFDIFTARLRKPLTGTINYNNLNNVLIYPNPCSGILYYQATEPIQYIDVYDMTGVKLLSLDQADSGLTGKVKLENFSSGIYFIKLSGKNSTYLKRLMIHSN